MATVMLSAPLEARGAPAHGQARGQPQTGLEVIALSIRTQDGKRHDYRVELAKTPEQQAHGMMFRTRMAPRTGMLFPMTPAREAGFWMRNTLIPLDLLFIGADGRVRNIAAMAVPHSESLLLSDGPVAAVLELAGGEAARIGVKPGDRVEW
ncbi:DUF192 domain-containing protein [Sandaracinobacteroides sp. A072]|uniref:DUF192 domain-containing protein n=1 Tax=Sandaracinobacteroides sp. A072 TaxID=3461146 RepID=UPI0040431989